MLSAIRKSLHHWHQFGLLSLLVSVAMPLALIGMPANSAHAQLGSAPRSIVAAAAAGDVIGHLDAVSQSAFGQIQIAGWAADPRTPNAALQVHAYITGPNGVLGFAGNYTGQVRGDVASALGWPGSKAGFNAVLPTAGAGFGSNSVCVYAISIAAPVTNPLLGCLALTTALRAPMGNVDAIAVNGASAVLSGWTFDPNSRDVSNQVHIYVNNGGASGGTAFVADHARQDVNSVFGIKGPHGFSETVALGGGSNTIFVYGIGENNNNSLIGSFAVVQDTPPRTWLSGASGEGVGTGAFAAWRGTPVPIVKTWSDGNAANGMVELWGINGASAEYGSTTASVDISSGFIWKADGDTWAAAAAGAYDARITAMYKKAKTEWTRINNGKTLYISPAIEWNYSGMPWNVQPGEITDFINAWRRFYNLKQAIFPASKLVFVTNGNTAGFSYDWRTGWPGDAYVDVYATDWYSNHWQLGGTFDSAGAPQGLEQHRLFALAHGKPFAVPEWGVNSGAGGTGDKPEYITYMNDFFKANGGAGAGNLLYECYFNVIWTPNYFGLHPRASSLAPSSSDRYVQLF